MLNNEGKQIIQMLLQATQPLTSEEISFQLPMSSKTIRRRLKEMESIVQEHGAKIISKKGTGIHLEIVDEDAFHSFQQSIQLTSSPIQQSNQLRQLINILLKQVDFVKADDLADMLYVSKSKLTQMLNEVRSILESYNLTIAVKPYYGLKIDGKEFDFRRFISSYYAQDYSELNELLACSTEYDMQQLDGIKFQKIRHILEICLAQYQYSMPLNILESLLVHLYISILRLEKGMSIKGEFAISKNERHKREYELAQLIIQHLEQEFDISFPTSEYEYLLIHLVSKKVMDISERNNIPMEVNELVDKMLQRVKETTNIDLTMDLDLRIMLGLHMVPLLSRLKYHIEMKNPILDEVRLRCVAGFDLAIICAKEIYKQYKERLSEHEISYFALHLDVAIHRGSDHIHKKNILVICSSGRASAQLLRYKFKNLFAKYIDRMDVCDASDALSHIEHEQYDYIFTTIPWSIDTLIPIFEFQFFLNSESVEMIRSVLHGDLHSAQILQYFREDMFLGVQNLSTKEEVLTYMMKQLHQVIDLPSAFDQLVWEREEVFGTDILPQVALPHPNQVITKETFVSVLILKKPIVWQRGKVRMVFLISISRENSEQYKFLFEWLINLLSNTNAIKHMVEKGNYETIREELLNIVMKEN